MWKSYLCGVVRICLMWIGNRNDRVNCGQEIVLMSCGMDRESYLRCLMWTGNPFWLVWCWQEIRSLLTWTGNRTFVVWCEQKMCMEIENSVHWLDSDRTVIEPKLSDVDRKSYLSCLILIRNRTNPVWCLQEDVTVLCDVKRKCAWILNTMSTGWTLMKVMLSNVDKNYMCGLWPSSESTTDFLGPIRSGAVCFYRTGKENA